jgi:bifunctional non-homologous end joining protein LigD
VPDAVDTVRGTRLASALDMATVADEQRLDASPDEMDALERLEGGGIWHVGGQEIRLSNLDKVLFPDGSTKRDLIRYYATAGPLIIPYLRGRAVNLHRYPDGVGSGKGFWQKDLPPRTPKWIPRWRYVHRVEGPTDYCVVDRLATLVWLAQEAAVELHPWTSRTDAPDEPTYALIDVDPGERTTWEEVLVLTRLYGAALEHLNVIGLPKVTGRRGIQVWIPVRRGYSFADTREWVESVSRAIGRTVPDLVSWEWSRRSRGGRARLDYTQNAINRTLVAPYSVRSSPAASVSMPIRWEELTDRELRPDGWNIRTAVDRVRETGDLFARALSLEQELSAL